MNLEDFDSQNAEDVLTFSLTSEFLLDTNQQHILELARWGTTHSSSDLVRESMLCLEPLDVEQLKSLTLYQSQQDELVSLEVSACLFSDC